MSASASNDPTELFCQASRLESRVVSWLWPGRLGLGKLAMLEGDPGLGKSLVALDVCARLGTGQPFPDGSPSPGPACSIVINGEDDAKDTIRPRLISLGADLERVFVFDPREESDPLGIPGQTDWLAAAVARFGARLVVIDPIMAFLEPGVQTNSDQSVRRALLPLARLAQEHACAIWLVRHLNKTGRKHSLYRGGGSIGFISACRSGWLIAPESSSSRRRVLAQVKNNLAPPQPSLSFEVLLRDTGPPVLSWLGTSPWTADEILARQGRPTAPPQLELAREFLLTFLEPGPRTSREIWAEAQKHDFSEATLYRAKQEVEARSERVRVGIQEVSYWLLPSQKLPDSVHPDDAPPSLEPWLAPLREQFPPPTPIDDL